VKLRNRRKLVQAAIRHNNAWNWAFDKLIRAVCAAHNKMGKALEEAYEKARNERQAERT
jgi:hypothetical protein